MLITRGFRRMDSLLPQNRRFHLRQVELPVGARDRKKLRAAGEKFRSAAFVRFDVRLLVANDAVIRPAKLCERQRVRRRSVEDEKHFAIGLEDLAHPLGDAPGPFVIAIGRGLFRVRFGESGPGFRANRRGVVALEFVSVHRRVNRFRPFARNSARLILYPWS